MSLWRLQPLGEIEFGGDMVHSWPDEDEEPHVVGPMQVIARWDPESPQGTIGELFGEPDKARELPMSGPGTSRIEGQTVGGETVTIRDVFLTTRHDRRSHEYGPRRLAEFVAGDVELRICRLHPDAKPKAPEVQFLVPDDPIWVGFRTRPDLEGGTLPPFVQFEWTRNDLSVSTSHLVFSGTADLVGGPAHANRIAHTIQVRALNINAYDALDEFIKAAETVVGNLLLVTGLSARMPFHILGGIARQSRSEEQGCSVERLSFTRSRNRHSPPPRRSFNDVQIEREAFRDFLVSAMNVLVTDKHNDLLRQAVQSYVTSIHRAFDTQQFLSVCTAIEAMKEWHIQHHWKDRRVKGANRKAVEKNIKAALRQSAREGVIDGLSVQEAHKKMSALFTPSISTVLNDLVNHLQIPVDDLFNRSKGHGPNGPYKFDFLNVRNKLVHTGKPPKDPEVFHNVALRSRFFAERLLFTALGYPNRGFLNQQWPVKKP